MAFIFNLPRLDADNMTKEKLLSYIKQMNEQVTFALNSLDDRMSTPVEKEETPLPYQSKYLRGETLDVDSIHSTNPVYYDAGYTYPQTLVTGNGTTIAKNTDMNTLTIGGTYNINSGEDMKTLGGIDRVVKAFGAGGARVDVMHTNSPYTNLTGGVMQRITSQWGNGTYERFLPWTTNATWSRWRCVAPFVKSGTISAKSASWTNIVTGIVSPQGGDAYDVSISMPRGYARYVFHYGTSWTGQRYVSLGTNQITLQMSGTNLQIKTQSDTTDSYIIEITPLY